MRVNTAGNKTLHLIDDLAKYRCATRRMDVVVHCELVYHYDNTHGKLWLRFAKVKIGIISRKGSATFASLIAPMVKVEFHPWWQIGDDVCAGRLCKGVQYRPIENDDACWSLDRIVEVCWVKSNVSSSLTLFHNSSFSMEILRPIICHSRISGINRALLD